MAIRTNKKTSTEKQRLREISQLIKKDLTNLKKSKKEEPNTVEVICTPHDIFHSKKKRK
jgi:hypothetical protein